MDKLPDIQTVDFCNADEICNFANLTMQVASEAGMFLVQASYSREQREIRATAEEWVRRVEASIDTMTAGDALSVIYIFDLIHRIAYGKPAKTDYLDRYRLGAFEAFIRGDKSVDRYELFHALSDEIAKRNKAYFDRPLKWISLCLDRWHRNFLPASRRINYPRSPRQINYPRSSRQNEYVSAIGQNGYVSAVEQNGYVSAVGQSDYDTICQLTALLTSDLRAFETDQDAYKRRLLTTHLHLLSTNSSPNTFSSKASDILSSKAPDHPVPADPKTRKALSLLRFHAAKYLPSHKHTA